MLFVRGQFLSYQLTFTSDKCVCAGIKDKRKNGGTCEMKNDHSYHDLWRRNGLWCYVDTTLCSDAREHASKLLPGYGASRKACKKNGMYFTIRTF